MNPSLPDQRSPEAPALPGEPLAFMLYFVEKYRGWYSAILALEVAGAVSATLMPYVIGQTVKIITHLRANPEQVWSTLATPLFVFFLLNIAPKRDPGSLRLPAAALASLYHQQFRGCLGPPDFRHVPGRGHVPGHDHLRFFPRDR
jgi:hypothetical protein